MVGSITLIGYGIGVLGAGLGIGLIGYACCMGTARQPEMAGRLFTDFIKENKPLFFFLYYGSLDEAGHCRGWYGEDYMEWQRTLDAEVGSVIQALKDAGIYDDTVIILSADHGGKDLGHGGFTLLELETPFIVCGKEIRENCEFPLTVMQYDTAAVIADLLGIRIPEDWRGRPFPQIYQ